MQEAHRSGSSHIGEGVSVREMHVSEVGIRIRYFHEASDDYLLALGVDRDLLPEPEAWLSFFERDYERPLTERAHYALVWELDGQMVGFSSLDHIVFGEEAFMHLHIVEHSWRRRGLGANFVKLSASKYFEVFELKLVQSRLKGLLRRSVAGIVHPNLRCHKQRLAVNSALLYPGAYSFLILIHLGGVDQAITRGDGVCDTLSAYITA